MLSFATGTRQHETFLYCSHLDIVQEIGPRPPTACSIYTVSQKVHTFKLCNFAKSTPIFELFALHKNVRNLIQNSYDNTYITLSMLLRKFRADIQQIWKKLDRL